MDSILSDYVAALSALDCAAFLAWQRGRCWRMVVVKRGMS